MTDVAAPTDAEAVERMAQRLEEPGNVSGGNYWRRACEAAAMLRALFSQLDAAKALLSNIEGITKEARATALEEAAEWHETQRAEWAGVAYGSSEALSIFASDKAGDHGKARDHFLMRAAQARQEGAEISPPPNPNDLPDDVRQESERERRL